MLSGDKASLADALIDFLTSEEASEEIYEYNPEWFEAWLRKAADAWPTDALSPPADVEEAVDPHGRWGAAACGVEPVTTRERGRVPLPSVSLTQSQLLECNGASLSHSVSTACATGGRVACGCS